LETSRTTATGLTVLNLIGALQIFKLWNLDINRREPLAKIKEFKDYTTTNDHPGGVEGQKRPSQCG
jgi:hypothetical protein